MESMDEVMTALEKGDEQPSNAVLVSLMTKYGLTAKQAGYVYHTMLNPKEPVLARAGAAGYAIEGVKSNSYEALRGTKTVNALTDLAERRAEIERESGKFVEEIKADARTAIRGELARHAKNPDIAPNQTRALELLGKMEGVFIERVELDAGPHTRARFADEVVDKLAKTSEETE